MPEFEIKARIIAETQEDAIRAFVNYWRIFRPDIDLDAPPLPLVSPIWQWTAARSRE